MSDDSSQVQDEPRAAAWFRFLRPANARPALPNAWPLPGAATALCLTGDSFGQMHDLAALEYSHEGLNAVSATPIQPGSNVSLGFQAQGYAAKRGVVQWCEAAERGYRLIVKFEARLAA